jgi:hypothetical protein
MKLITKLIILSLITIKIFSQENYNCDDYQILEIKDTTELGEPSLYLTLTTNNNPVGTGYTDLFFVNQFNDTINQSGFWGSWLPSNTNIPNDTINYILPYVSGIIAFPLNFNGYLITRNPDCQIAFNFSQFLSVDEFNNNSEVTLYPNPASNKVLIKTPFQIKSVELIDSEGRLRNLKAHQINNLIDISHLKSGFYILRINLNNDKSLIRKLIKY